MTQSAHLVIMTRIRPQNGLRDAPNGALRKQEVTVVTTNQPVGPVNTWATALMGSELWDLSVLEKNILKFGSLTELVPKTVTLGWNFKVIGSAQVTSHKKYSLCVGST